MVIMIGGLGGAAGMLLGNGGLGMRAGDAFGVLVEKDANGECV
jgi:hypothetical protein